MAFQSINHRKDREGEVEEGGVEMRGDGGWGVGGGGGGGAGGYFFSGMG